MLFVNKNVYYNSMKKTSLSTLKNKVISHLTENQGKYLMEWQKSINTKYLIIDEILNTKMVKNIDIDINIVELFKKYVFLQQLC